MPPQLNKSDVERKEPPSNIIFTETLVCDFSQFDILLPSELIPLDRQVPPSVSNTLQIWGYARIDQPPRIVARLKGIWHLFVFSCTI